MGALDMKRLFLLVPVLVLGCPRVPSEQENDAGTTADFVGRACNVDAECGALRCDKVRRQCICLSDLSCNPDNFGAQKFCNNYTGLCVTEISGCKGNLDCAPGQFCDPSTRTCTALRTFCQSCTHDRECGGQRDDCLLDETLNRRFCGTSCEADGDCPRGATCQAFDGGVNQCWPGTTANGQQATCNNFQSCTPDSLQTCDSDEQCQEASQRCEPTLGKCVAAQKLCPFGTSCDPRTKLCLADCLQDADCGDDLLRCVNRICEPVSECTSDDDCLTGRSCAKAPGATSGECKPSCSFDSECALGQICVAGASRASCQPGCSSNAGCPLDQRCNQTTSQCEGPVVSGQRVCQATSACDTCEVCDPVNTVCKSDVVSVGGGSDGFPHCGACSSNGDCPGGDCVGLSPPLPDGGMGGVQTVCARLCGAGLPECPQGFACLILTSGESACIPADRNCAGKCQ